MVGRLDQKCLGSILLSQNSSGMVVGIGSSGSMGLIVYFVHLQVNISLLNSGLHTVHIPGWLLKVSATVKWFFIGMKPLNKINSTREHEIC